ncbi:M24 family metallopeptidase [Oceanobacillus oncorhynchi subsp. oncorhynchi]|uniref:M24 family metallopeptidase n=1 Tax=Oceanobacillus oncorhynchi TaxID=545501 RepID=UPI0036451C97
MNQRKKSILNIMKYENVDVLVLTAGTNLHYVTENKLTGSERLFLYFLKQDGTGIYIVPEVEKSKIIVDETETILFYKDEAGPYTLLQQLENKLSSLQTFAVETKLMRLFEFNFIKELGVHTYSDANKMMQQLRLQKDPDEIVAIQKAVNILEESFKATLPFIKIGKTEVEIAAKLEYEMRVRGSEGTPFTTIVASGYRGALPHGRASEKKIEDGDLIVIDFGSTYQGYVGDMTRTIGIGNISEKQKAIYQIVKQSIDTSINAIQIGKNAADIDTVARQVIEDSGYGLFFTHRLGHGIGLDAHESPYMSQADQTSIRQGMVFTVEPGIYIENEFGIRIEDNIVITENGAQNLMTISHDLIIL